MSLSTHKNCRSLKSDRIQIIFINHQFAMAANSCSTQAPHPFKRASNAVAFFERDDGYDFSTT